MAGYGIALTIDGSESYALARKATAAYSLAVVPTLGENITRLRTAAGKTNAAAFARSMGITPTTLNDWEAGRYKNLRLDSLLSHATALNVSVDALLSGVDRDYDRVIVRAVSAHAKEMPSPVPLHEVEQTHPGSGSISKGGATHAAEQTTAKRSADRVSESESAADKYVREFSARVLHRRDLLQELVDRLHASADEVRAIAEILQPGSGTQGVGTKRSADAPRASSGAGRRHRKSGR